MMRKGILSMLCIIALCLGIACTAVPTDGYAEQTYAEAGDTDIPMFAVTASPVVLSFGTADEGYASAPAALTVTVTNIGNRTVTLEQPASTEHFEVGALSDDEIAAGGTATFTVQPKTDLPAGAYSDRISVRGTGGGNSVVADVFAGFAVLPTASTAEPDDGGRDSILRASAAIIVALLAIAIMVDGRRV